MLLSINRCEIKEMKIIRNLFFIVVLSQVFAAPRRSPHISRPSTPVTQPPSQSNSPSRTTAHEPEQLDEELTRFKKWNKYLKEYVHKNIPEIKANSAIRDYLLRVEYWAPKSLALYFEQHCETAQFNRIMESTGLLPLPMTDDECRELAYEALREEMENGYTLMEDYCRAGRLVNELSTLVTFRINKFLVFKTIGECAYEHFNVRKEPTTPENIGKSILDGLKYVKEHFDPLPCPYNYQPY